LYSLPEKFGRNTFLTTEGDSKRSTSKNKRRFKTPIFAIPLLDREPEGLDYLKQLQKDVFN
jgi:hypothetical protein